MYVFRITTQGLGMLCNWNSSCACRTLIKLLLTSLELTYGTITFVSSRQLCGDLFMTSRVLRSLARYYDVLMPVSRF